MRLIIYAVGGVFQRHKDKINWEEVIALADKKIVETGSIKIGGRVYSVISPATVSELSYDYIVVFSDLYFEEIKMELSGEYFIPKDRIMPYREIIGDNGFPAMKFVDCCRIFYDEKKCRKVLDCGMSVLSRYYLATEEVFSCKEVQIDGISNDITDFNTSLYRNVYQNFLECEDDYDMVLVWQEPNGLEREIESAYKKGRYILFSTGYLFRGTSAKELLNRRLGRFGKISCLSGREGLFWVIDTALGTKIGTDGKNISIYVVTHKKYNCLSRGIYKPLCVGGYAQEGYLTDQTEDNIAGLNEKINECTALYWIWKNTKGDYTGLNHYRRYFYNNEIKSMDNYLNAERISEILNEYDIILPQTYRTTYVYGQLVNSVDPELLKSSYKNIRNLIKERQPDYLESFDSVMDGCILFTCNMFVTRREILNRYCEWLFSFLIKAAEETDVEGYDDYSRRVIGFFAERMWTVWLRKNRLKIKELPYVTGWLPTGKM